MNNIVYDKNMENLRNRVDTRLGSNEKDYFKLTSKLSFMSQKKTFRNYLVAIRKNKVTLSLTNQHMLMHISVC